MKRTFAVLDIKNNEICAVAARWGRNGEYSCCEFIKSPASGIYKGVVRDVDAAVDSISRVLQKLSGSCGERIHEVYVNVTAPSVSMYPSSGTLLLSKYGREISQLDIEKCKKIASIIKLPPEKEPLHRLVKEYGIDGEGSIKNPLGLEGLKLHVDMNIVAVDLTVVRNMEKCVSFAGFSLEGLIFSGIADANRLIPRGKIENGVLFVNISRELTEIEVFRHSVLVDCRVVQYGTDELVSTGGEVKGEQMEKLLADIKALKEWDLVKEIVVAGPGILNEQFMDTMEAASGIPVRSAVCGIKPFENLPVDCMRYAGCLGILDHLQEERRGRITDKNPFKIAFRYIVSFLDRYF